MGGSLRIVIGGVPKGSRRDHNIVRVSSFASKELSWHKRRCIVLVVLVGCSLNRNSSLPFFLRAIDPLLSSMISTKNSSLRIVVLRIGILQSLHKAVYKAVYQAVYQAAHQAVYQAVHVSGVLGTYTLYPIPWVLCHVLDLPTLGWEIQTSRAILS